MPKATWTLCPDSQPGSAATSCALGPLPSHQDRCCGPSPHWPRQPWGDRRGWLCLRRLQNPLPWQPRVQACPALEMSVKRRISLVEQTGAGAAFRPWPARAWAWASSPASLPGLITRARPMILEGVLFLHPCLMLTLQPGSQRRVGIVLSSGPLWWGKAQQAISRNLELQCKPHPPFPHLPSCKSH